MGFVENDKSILRLDPESRRSHLVDRLNGWNGSGLYRYKEWQSPDKKRTIVCTMLFNENGSIRQKDIRLLVEGYIATAQMFRAQVFQDDDGKLDYIIYIDAVDEKGDRPNYIYRKSNNGRLEEPHAWSSSMKFGKYEVLTDKQFGLICRQDLLNEGVYAESRLPKQINVKGTINLFLMQILKGDFSKPVLIEDK